MMKKLIYALAFTSFSLLWSCEFEVDEPYEPDVVKAADIQLINEKIAERGWPAPDTTLSGARYIIFRNEGDTTTITPKSEDIVSFDYIGYFLNGTVFDTSIPAVADTAFTDTGDIIFEPVVYTFSETGWTLRYVPVVSQYLFSNTPSTALQEAISVTFGQMTIGDTAAIFIPSTEAGTSTRLRENAIPLQFDVTIVEIDQN